MSKTRITIEHCPVWELGGQVHHVAGIKKIEGDRKRLARSIKCTSMEDIIWRSKIATPGAGS